MRTCSKAAGLLVALALAAMPFGAVAGASPNAVSSGAKIPHPFR